MNKRWLTILFLLLGATAIANQGMTSPTHKENVGKIVFSDQEVKFRKEDPSQLKESFQLGEPIYARAYFAQPIRSSPWVLNGQPTDLGNLQDTDYEIRMYFDGVHQEYRFGKFFGPHGLGPKSAFEWTTFQVNLTPKEQDKGERYMREAWAKLTRKLSPGPHKVRMELWGVMGQAQTASAMAVGEFTLNVREGSAVEAGSFPADSYSGSDLEQLKSIMRGVLVGPVAKSGSEILDVSVTSDWREGRYTDTLVRYRKIQGTVLWHDSDGDGYCRFTSYSFIQTWTGNGWGSLQFKAFVNGGPEGEVKAK